MMAIGVLAGPGGPSTGLSNGTPHSNNTPNTVSDIQHPKKNHKNHQNCTFGTILTIKCIRF